VIEHGTHEELLAVVGQEALAAHLDVERIVTLGVETLLDHVDDERVIARAKELRAERRQTDD
jgi:hypothetical protein